MAFRKLLGREGERVPEVLLLLPLPGLPPLSLGAYRPFFAGRPVKRLTGLMGDLDVSSFHFFPIPTPSRCSKSPSWKLHSVAVCNEVAKLLVDAA